MADLFHWGHARFFERARALGDHLTVCVVPDERVQAAKRLPVMTTRERAAIVSACRWVDEVITDGPKQITMDFMVRNGFSVYAFGASDELEMKVKLEDCIEIPDSMKAHIPYEKGVSTSEIIHRIAERLNRGHLELGSR